MPTAVGQARPLRWLFAAPLTTSPSGRASGATGERFQNIMGRLAPAATVEIPDGLGAGSHRSIRLSFGRPRDFKAAEVIRQVEVLGTLTAIADELDKKGDLAAARTKLRKAVGEGTLWQAIEQLQAEPASAPDSAPAPTSQDASSTPTPTASEGGSALDAIFAKADLSPAPATSSTTTAAKSGLNAFIGAMRSSGASSKVTPAAANKSLARDVALLVRRAVDAAVLDLMAAPAIASLESAWRGLRTVMSASPGADSLAVDLLDTDVGELVSRLAARLDVAPMDRPDAVFVPIAISDIERLQALADLGQRYGVPIVVEVPDATTGAWLDDQPDPPPAPEAWTELRARPSTVWLCACSNAIVLANEELGVARRIVFGSPVWGVAAMLSASVGQTAGPGQIFGRAGALVGPASYGLDEGGTESIATERLATIDQQRTFAERGVLVLGSERGSDRLRLSAAPMVHAHPDEPQLPGRILVGRATRLGQAVRDELPPQATEREVAARLAEASTNFLPRSPHGAVALEVRTDEQGKLGVDASIGAALAGASFKFSSDL